MKPRKLGVVTRRAETDGTGAFEAQEAATPQPEEAPERPQESTVEVLDEGWGEQSVGAAETPWNSDDDERQQEFADASGQSHSAARQFGHSARAGSQACAHLRQRWNVRRPCFNASQ